MPLTDDAGKKSPEPVEKFDGPEMGYWGLLAFGPVQIKAKEAEKAPFAPHEVVPGDEGNALRDPSVSMTRLPENS